MKSVHRLPIVFHHYCQSETQGFLSILIQMYCTTVKPRSDIVFYNNIFLLSYVFFFRFVHSTHLWNPYQLTSKVFRLFSTLFYFVFLPELYNHLIVFFFCTRMRHFQPRIRYFHPSLNNFFHCTRHGVFLKHISRIVRRWHLPI